MIGKRCAFLLPSARRAARLAVALVVAMAALGCSPGSGKVGETKSASTDNRERYLAVLRGLSDAVVKDDFAKAAGYCTFTMEEILFQDAGGLAGIKVGQIVSAGYIALKNPPDAGASIFKSVAETDCKLKADMLALDDVVYAKAKEERVLVKGLRREGAQKEGPSTEVYFPFVDDGEKATLLVALTNFKSKNELCMRPFDGFKRLDGSTTLLLKHETAFYEFKNLSIHDWWENGWAVPAGAQKVDDDGEKKKSSAPQAAAAGTGPSEPTLNSMDDIKVAGRKAVGQVARLKVQKMGMMSAKEVKLVDDDSREFMILQVPADLLKQVKEIPGVGLNNGTVTFKVTRVGGEYLRGQILDVEND
jgi:hypothetical protein